MDAFNYLSVMVSMIVGLGLTQLFAGIGNLVQIRRRVQRYWLHTTWVFLLIALHIHMWWSLWALRVHGDWTFGYFLYVLLGPALLVIASHIVIPELVDRRIEIEQHYFDTAPLFFGILAAGAAWAMLLEPIMGLRSFLVPFRAAQGIGVISLICCAVSSNRRVHAAASLVIVAVLAVSILLARFHLTQVDPVPVPNTAQSPISSQ